MKSIEALHQGRSFKRHQNPLRRGDVRVRRMLIERQRDQFMALLAHELLTPLTCIIGWSQLAHEQVDPTAIYHALDVIERNARRQKLLLDDLLAALHFTRGSTLAFNPKQIDLWNLVEHHKERQRPCPIEHQLSLAFDGTDAHE